MPTLCFTGMDRAEEAKLKLLFSDANEWLGGTWTLVSEAQAQVIIVDLDSIYGHMTWLKVHNTGKYIVAITGRAESDAEHVMVRPVTVESLVAALSEVTGKSAMAPQQVSAAQAMASAREAGAQAPEKASQREAPERSPPTRPAATQEAPIRPPARQAPTMREEMLAKAAPPPLPQSPRRDAPVARTPEAQQPVRADAPGSTGQQPEPRPRPPQAPAPPLPPAPTPAQQAPVQPAPTQPAPVQPAPVQHYPQQTIRKPAAPGRQRDPVLWDYLQTGALPAASCMELAGAPPLVINPQSDSYFGAQALKPYVPYCQLGSVHAGEWRTVATDEFAILKATYGEPQPLSRLRWLYALVQGRGELAPGYDPSDKFRLTKWPKTEREYPKHLRIATTMMQGPGTPAEIAAKSDTPLADVNDFINASLESGFAELHNAPPSGPDSGSKPGGLLGRLRGMRNG